MSADICKGSHTPGPWIAAAPDLLAALRNIVDDCDYAIEHGRPMTVGALLLADIRAAIAKAEGKP